MSTRSILSRAIVLACLGAATTFGVSSAFALKGFVQPTPTEEPVAILLGDQSTTAMFGPPLHGRGWSLYRTNIAQVISFDRSSITPKLPPALGTHSIRRTLEVPDQRRAVPPGAVTQQEFRFGWPLRSSWAVMNAATLMEVMTKPQTERIIVLKQTAFPGMIFYETTERLFKPRGYAIPIGVLPLGFSVNTVFYGMTWALLYFSLIATRRSLRRRRNLCPTCAYDLRATPTGRPCPECGAVVTGTR